MHPKTVSTSIKKLQAQVDLLREDFLDSNKFKNNLKHFIDTVNFCQPSMPRDAKWKTVLGSVTTHIHHFNKKPFAEQLCAWVALQNMGRHLSTISSNITQEEARERVQEVCLYYQEETAPFKDANRKARMQATRVMSRKAAKLETLISAGQFSCPKPKAEWTPADVDSYHEECQHLMNFRRFDLDDLRRAHGCSPCYEVEPKAEIPNFPYSKVPNSNYYTAPGGSAIPFIPGLFCTGLVTKEDYNKHQFHEVCDGTTIGLSQVPGQDSPEVALFIHIPTQSEVASEPSYGRLAKLLHELLVHGSVCGKNGAWAAVDQPGTLKAFGWHSYWFSKHPVRMYAGQKECDSCSIKEVQQIFHERFMSILAVNAARETQDFLAENGIPSFGESSVDFALHEAALGSNFTISFGGFANLAHLDNDGFRYVFSVYIFIDEDGNLVTDNAQIKECMSYGHFLWPDLHLSINTSACNGIVLFFWRGTYERHCTMECQLEPEECRVGRKKVTRYGTSVQVNKSLLSRMLSHHQAMEEWNTRVAWWELNGSKGCKPTMPPQPRAYN